MIRSESRKSYRVSRSPWLGEDLFSSVLRSNFGRSDLLTYRPIPQGSSFVSSRTWLTITCVMGRILLAECGISGFSCLLPTFPAFLQLVFTEVTSVNESNVVDILLKIVTKRERNDFYLKWKTNVSRGWNRDFRTHLLVNYFRLFEEPLISQSVPKSCA